MSLHLLRAAARPQDGVFTVDHLSAAGLTPDELRTLVEHGIAARVHRGVYVFVGTSSRPTLRQLGWSACLATGGVLSHWSAARVYGMREAPEHPVHVTSGRAGRREPAGVKLHRAPRVALGPRTLGIPVTSPARTLVDLAGLGVPEPVLHKFVGVLVSSKAADLENLATGVERCVGVPGVRRARALLQQIAGPIESVLETEFDQLLRGWGLPLGVPQYRVRIASASYRVDRAWPEFGVLLELDGYESHSDPSAFEADRRRQNDLVAAGFLVLRGTWKQVHGRSAALRRQLEVALGPAGRPAHRDGIPSPLSSSGARTSLIAP